jgi:hypothetical protein
MMKAMRHAFVCGYSRSGTTLLATILDSHPGISMGYELMPAGLPPLPETVAHLRRALSIKSIPPAATLRADPATEGLATFVAHATWALVGPQELLQLLERWLAAGITDVHTLQGRARLALAVVERKQQKEGTALTGYKVQTSRFGRFDRLFAESGFIGIVRDPRDVVASQMGRGFERSVERIANHWRDYYSRFQWMVRLHRRRAVLVRYEDLVTRPEPQYERIFGMLGLEYGDEVRRYWESKASIHRTRHNNAPAVGQELFTRSLGRWQNDLAAAQAAQVERVCRRLMYRLGYPASA